MPSIKKNFFYSSILTTANYIVPLITFPYVSRVLGATNIGICNFVDSVINYFVIFSMLGISTIGIREIAACKGDRLQLSKTFSSLLSINIFTTVALLAVLIAATFLVPKFADYKQMLFVGSFKLVYNCFLIEWFFRGLEDFKYITVRTIAVRLIYVIAVFVFVRKADDYIYYYILTTAVVVINAVINLAYSHKFAHFSFKDLSLKPLIKPLFILGIYNVLLSMYTSFNVVYLGFVGGDTQVGYYTTATKIHSIILSLYTAFTGVMLPRMSALLSEKKEDEFRSLIHKSFELLFCFAIPIILYSVVFAHEIITLISGTGYEPAVPCLRIILPLILIIGYEQILVTQTLVPMKLDKAILINSIVGAVVGLVGNILLVNTFYAEGSSWTWVLSEIAVLISAQYFVSKYTGIKFQVGTLTKHLLLGAPVCIAFLFISQSSLQIYSKLIVSVIVLLMYYYIGFYYILKVPVVINVVNSVRKKKKLISSE
jgi:O-antigen/teichoic acid export membrane protein